MSSLHRNTINNIEVDGYVSDSRTPELIEKVLGQAGVEFIAENGGPGGAP
jgi:hypothetical protein